MNTYLKDLNKINNIMDTFMKRFNHLSYADYSHVYDWAKKTLREMQYDGNLPDNESVFYSKTYLNWGMF